MGKRNDIDKAVRNIRNWSERSEWSDELTTIFDAHLGSVCELMDVSSEDLNQLIVEHDYGGMLFGVMFEDFLSRRLSPGNRNVTDDYLARRGWRESPAGRRYLQQLRDSVLSVYEAVAVSPGKYCELVDLVRGGKIIRVHEHMGTQNMVKWDRIAARVLNTNGQRTFSGGILPFPHEASQDLLTLLTKLRKQFDKKHLRKGKKGAKTNLPSSENPDYSFLRDACPSFTSTWLIHVLEQLQKPLPEIVNRDGDSLVFSETRFPFLPERADEIAKRLNAAADWERDSLQTDAWIWLAEPSTNAKRSRDGLAFNTSLEGQRPISGTLELKSGVLTLLTNSLELAERGTDILEELLHNLIGPALSLLQTPEQLLAGQPQQDSDRKCEPTENIDRNIEAEIIHRTLDQHYHRCLDEPIPALDNKTPRQCVRSKTGRKKVIEWLKLLENNELRRAAEAGQEPYDSSWMWKELNLTSQTGVPR